MQSDVVAEIEEDTGNRYGNAGGETDVQRIEFLLDVPLVEILESDLALPVPDVAYFRSAEYGKAVRPFLNDVVSVDYGNLEAVDGRGDSGFSKVMLQRFIVYDSSGCRKWRLKFIRMKNEPK